MGCLNGTGSKVAVTEESKAIDKELKEANSASRRMMKILLLGTGDSGKSTFSKQLAFNNKQLSDSMAATFAPVLRENALNGAHILVGVLLQYIEQAKAAIPDDLQRPVNEILNATALTPATADLIEHLWKSPMIQKLLDRRGEELQLQGGVAGVQYYFQNAKRFAGSDFVPTFDDILQARRKTSGVIETTFEQDGVLFNIVDVGGQRSERKKWLHCFTDVTAVIFLAAINEYDMVLEEDASTNRFLESLKLWKALSASDFFKGTPFILFLNKSDLFEKKLAKAPLSEIFADWEDYVKAPAISKMILFEQGWRFLGSQYEKHFSGKSFTMHVTCALDREGCKKVWGAVQNELFKRAMEQGNIM